MILPIFAYGYPILRQVCPSVDIDAGELETLIPNMWETMHNADGCGLAAPQIGRNIRLFIVDSSTTYENMSQADKEAYFDADDHGIKETFINAQIVERSGTLWLDDEGCLSIPGLTYEVKRPWSVTIEYLNARMEKQTRQFSGLTARMIQHEYDHIEGILFTDHITSLTRKMMQSKLNRISRGLVAVKYPMKFPV